MTPSTGVEAPDGPREPTTERRRRLVLIGASVASFLVALDLLAITTALDEIRRDLDVSASTLQWTVTGYSVAFAALLLAGAALGDRYGRRRMFTLGLMIFGTGSVLAALSPGIEFLVASRVVQGIGGAIILPIGLTIVSTSFPAERRGTAIGILEGVSGLAVIAGPIAGGGITSLVGWQGIFWVNVPIILVAIRFMRRAVTESYGTDDGLDPAGLALATIASGAAVWALVRGNDVGWVGAEVFAAGSAALMAAAGFAAWEVRATHPMIPPRLCRRRNFTVGLGTAMFLSASLYGVVFFMAQFLQTSQGASPWGAALRLLPWTATLFLIAPIAGRVADGMGPRRVLAIGLAVQAVGLTWLYAVAGVDARYLAMLPALVVTGVGASAALPVSQLAIIEAVPDPDVGRAVGVNNMLQEVGGSVGVALTVAGFGLWGGGTAPEAFADGFRAVLLVGSGLSAIGAMLALGLRTRPPAGALVPRTECGPDSVAGARTSRTASAVATS